MTSPSPDRARESAGAGVPLVLVVDDNARNLKLACDVLRTAGIRTLEARTGSEAIALAAKQRPDVILLDLRLPDLAGTDVARELGSRPETAHIPVVALTAVRAEGDWRPEGGFVGYIPKPIEVRDFPDQVRRYCADASG